jgi:hypothetical protein
MSFNRESEYGEDTRRALAHITGRTRQGSFAAPLYNWPAARWAAAIEPLERVGIVKSGIATAADDPTVARGWVLAQLVQTEREQGVPVRLADGVGEGADRNVTDIDETPEPPRDNHWSVEQARWVVDDPAAVRAWLLAQDDVQQLARQHPAAGPGDEPSHQHPTDTDYYGSHDVTPGERESWDAETEAQDRAETSPTGDIAADPGAAVAVPDLEYAHLESHRAGQEAQRLARIATGGTPPRPARTTTPPAALPVRLPSPSQQPRRRR